MLCLTEYILCILSYDLVFSNWLMMYLEDEEVQTLVKKELSWLQEDGYLFARESCVKQSGISLCFSCRLYFMEGVFLL